MNRVRIFYQKYGWLRFTGTLDIQKIWERSCRRAKLPLAYSQGFHPQAKIQQACPLPLGFISTSEIVDIWFIKKLSTKFIVSALIPTLPKGITIDSIKSIHLDSPALQSQIKSAEYKIYINKLNSANIKRNIQVFNDKEYIPFVKRGKTLNLRRLVEQIDLVESKSASDDHIILHLTNSPGFTGRPEDILSFLEIPIEETIIERTKLIFDENKNDCS